MRSNWPVVGGKTDCVFRERVKCVGFRCFEFESSLGSHELVVLNCMMHDLTNVS